MKTVRMLVSTALATALLGGSAMAGEIVNKDTLFDVMDKNRWMIRVRAIDVVPDESSSTSIGGNVTAQDSAVPEIDFTYFFTDHVAAELIAATSKHDMGAANTSLGNLDLGDVWLLPPTLTLQYHFNPDAQFRPYLGAGVNYIYYYNEKPGAVNDISYENGFGTAVQAGFDYGLDEHWAINMDVKKIWHNVDAKLNGGAVTADVDLDPWVFGVGLSYRF